MARQILPLMILIFSLSSSPSHAQKNITLRGRVVESVAHKDVVRSLVYLLDKNGQRIDSVIAGNGETFNDGNGWYERANFSLSVPRKDSVFNFEVIHPDYAEGFFTYQLNNIGKREVSRDIPDFVLRNAPKTLDEVTVMVSKVKFYHKGDTIVYNADAFQLAEGSMLDALVKQLPGVELREGGQIYVNGEFVENLMLNGKDFFKGQNEIMLDNLPSYTVKNVEVYRHTDTYDQWAGMESKKSLVMDVKLKKDYNVGWIMNLEGGIGSSERYLGRTFINRFTNSSRISLIANINNLNDNRKPGESTTWTPAQNTTGTMITKMAGLDYQAGNNRGGWDLNGNVLARHTSQHDWNHTDRVNFLPDGSRPAEYEFSDSRLRFLELSTNHRAILNHKLFYHRFDLKGDYTKRSSDISSIGATFRNEQNDISQGILDTIFSGSPTMISDLINRAKITTKNTGHNASGDFSYSTGMKIPKTSDNIGLSASVSLADNKYEVWRDYIINYGSDPKPARHDNQYYDNSPNKTVKLNASLNYNLIQSTTRFLQASYSFAHIDSHKDSYMYALDRLSENGLIGILPADYLSAFDASGSYRSHSIENSHTVRLSYNDVDFSAPFSFQISPSLRYLDRNFDYFRGNLNHHVDQKHTLLILPDWMTQIWVRLGKFQLPGSSNTQVRHSLNFRFIVEPTIPEPVKMVDVVDANDPLNIWLGNSSLKPSYKLQTNFRWTLLTPINRRILNTIFEFDYSYRINEIVNGYSFNESTGIRTNKTYNVHSGNYATKFHVNTSYQFGSRNQFMGSYFGGVDYLHSADMIGLGINEPIPTSVYTWWQVHTLNLNWQIGKQQLGFRGQYNGRNTGSDREGFNKINAYTTTFSLTGQFKLPYGFGISTDFNIYSRHGYGAFMDKDEPVWNTRLSWTPTKIPFVFMLDGFDLFHRLSNVQYAIDDKGRTITYTNVLPRYVLFHIQYKLNILPKKKVPQTKVYDY